MGSVRTELVLVSERSIFCERVSVKPGADPAGGGAEPAKSGSCARGVSRDRARHKTCRRYQPRMAPGGANTQRGYQINTGNYVTALSVIGEGSHVIVSAVCVGGGGAKEVRARCKRCKKERVWVGWKEERVE